MNRIQRKAKLNRARLHTGHTGRPLTVEVTTKDMNRSLLGKQVRLVDDASTPHGSYVLGLTGIVGRVVGVDPKGRWVLVRSSQLLEGHDGYQGDSEEDSNDIHIHHNRCTSDTHCWWFERYQVRVVK